MGMTTRQVQEALRQIGWPLTVDGSFGPVTRQAVIDFQRGYTPVDLLIDGYAGPQTQTALNVTLFYGGHASEHFTFREFASKGNGWIKVHRELIRGLEEVRKRYGPVIIESGHRDILHNQREGGKPNSQHLYGNGSDIRESLGLTAPAAKSLKMFSGIGIKRSSGKVIHVDVRHVGPNTTRSSVFNPAVWYYA